MTLSSLREGVCHACRCCCIIIGVGDIILSTYNIFGLSSTELDVSRVGLKISRLDQQ
jgi:hypothetical protein